MPKKSIPRYISFKLRKPKLKKKPQKKPEARPMQGTLLLELCADKSVRYELQAPSHGGLTLL